MSECSTRPAMSAVSLPCASTPSTTLWRQKRLRHLIGAVSVAGCLLSTTGASAQSASDATVQAGPSEWSAALLLSQCKETSDPTAQAQCVGAIRGIVHGYQYGVLLTANDNHIDTSQLETISICLNGVPVKTLIAEFVADAGQADSDDLAKTPAETVVLGVIHHHHRCQ